MPDTWKPQLPAVYIDWADTILEHGKDITAWEQQFTKDIRQKLSITRLLLSQKQAEILERIYSEKT